MQNYLFDLNFKRGLRPIQLRNKVAIAAPTPTTIQQRHRVVNISNIKTVWALNERPHLLPVIGPLSLDGVYAIHELDSKNVVFNLLQFLKMAKDQYKLSDYDAICLLSFFKINFMEARRHLYNDGTHTEMLLDVDAPWRLQIKSISEFSITNRCAKYTFFKSPEKMYMVNSKVMTNVLPQKALAQQFAGRYLRIQRTYYHEHIIFVGCVLPFKQKPFEIATLLLPSSVQKELTCCIELMNQLEIYLAPLVLVSNIWSEHDQKRTKYISFDARVFEEGYFN